MGWINELVCSPDFETSRGAAASLWRCNSVFTAGPPGGVRAFVESSDCSAADVLLIQLAESHEDVGLGQHLEEKKRESRVDVILEEVP